MELIYKYQKIKFGYQAFSWAAAGANQGESGGKITFQKRRLTFEEIEAVFKANRSIKPA